MHLFNQGNVIAHQLASVIWIRHEITRKRRNPAAKRVGSDYVESKGVKLTAVIVIVCYVLVGSRQVEIVNYVQAAAYAEGIPLILLMPTTLSLILPQVGYADVNRTGAQTRAD